MKKLLLVAVLFVCTVSAVKAEEINGNYWDVAGFTFTYPLANVDASFVWKSISTGDEMFGIQSTLISYPKKPITIHEGIVVRQDMFKLAFGGITSFKANGMPYLAISTKLWNLTTLQGEELLHIGIGYGHDFKEHQSHFILGATTKLW